MQETFSNTSPDINFSLEEALNKQIKQVPFKRALDFFLSFTGLIILSPLFLIAALLTKFSSKGTVIYSQQRIGLRGAAFNCYKFRTMRHDADEELKALFTNSPELLQEWMKHRKLKNDPRVTKFGRFLRCTSMDELPQLWNVMKGDLSLVGPRPVVQAELNLYYKNKAAKILSVRPGITGLWQISGRNRLNYEERILLDEQYIDAQSLRLDLQILFKTLPVIIYGDGAY